MPSVSIPLVSAVELRPTRCSERGMTTISKSNFAELLARASFGLMLNPGKFKSGN